MAGVEKRGHPFTEMGWNKGAFVGEWAWNGKYRKKSDEKREMTGAAAGQVFRRLLG